MAKSSGVSINVDTALMAISTSVLLIGVGYTWYRLQQVTGSWLPWFGG